MNIKKIGLTALGSSLIATSAFAGSLDVTGSAGMSFGGANVGTSANGFSMYDEVTFSGGGEMDNGWTVNVSYQLDSSETATGNMDNRSLTIDTNGLGVITFSGHGGDSAMSAVDDVMPTAYGEAWDIISNTLDNGSVGTAANFNAIGSAGSNNILSYSNADLMDGLKLTVSYVPSGTGEVESSTDFAIEYTGYEGLTVGYAAGENNAAGGTGNTDNETMYIKYAYGPVTVGYQESEIDATAATADDEFDALGITYQITDSLTVGYTESNYNAGDKTADQESSNMSFSYTAGGITLAGGFAEEKNRGGETTAANDVKGYELDLSFAF